MEQGYEQNRPDYPVIEQPQRRAPQQTAPLPQRRPRRPDGQTGPVRRQDTRPQRPLQQQAQQQQQPRERYDQDKSVDAMLNRMEDQVSDAKKMPFSDQVLVDREEMLFLIRMIRENLPEELRQARWLLQQNRQLIQEARKEAEQIMREAEQQMTRMIDEHEITQQAQTEASHIMDDASQRSQQIQQHAVNYAKTLLADLEDQLTEMLVFIQRNKKEIDQ